MVKPGILPRTSVSAAQFARLALGLDEDLIPTKSVLLYKACPHLEVRLRHWSRVPCQKPDAGCDLGNLSYRRQGQAGGKGRTHYGTARQPEGGVTARTPFLLMGNGIEMGCPGVMVSLIWAAGRLVVAKIASSWKVNCGRSAERIL